MKNKLIDRAEFTVGAGNGGHGSIHFRREKYVPKGGPDGGNGGRGGAVVMRVDPHLATLKIYSGKDRFKAENGRSGGKRQRSGDDGENKVLVIPAGTVVWVRKEDSRLLRGRQLYGEDVERMIESGYRTDTVPYRDFEERWGEKSDEEWVQVSDMDEDSEDLVIAVGGRGGLGNDTYKSSKHTTPKVAQRGEYGERFEVKLELKLLADVGLVGLPNAGKSTLLSVITSAKPEIASYPFTTLSPNLGVMEHGGKSVVVADIPGLIEDAHKGKGLGTDFLRHIERCNLLLYVISPKDEELEVSDAELGKSLFNQYKTLEKEVLSYEGDMTKKKSLIVINKMDLMLERDLDKLGNLFEKKGLDVIEVSAVTGKGIDELKLGLTSLVGS